VEQVVTQPGSVRRLQVVAMIRKPLDARQEEQVRKMIAAAVGASGDRGDTVVVQTMEAFPAIEVVDGVPSPPPGLSSDGASAAGIPQRSASLPLLGLVACLVALLAALMVFAVLRRQTRPKPPPLTSAQREDAVRRVQDWMNQDTAAAGGTPVP
ncbi:MAG: flagellar M-ring protein FliF, partial [Comamonadaceae bacterium]